MASNRRLLPPKEAAGMQEQRDIGVVGEPPTGSEALLSAQGLACKRGRRLLFKDLNLRLERGRVLWLRGSNGSGKTSLMRILAGLSSPHAGTVLWRGRPLQQASNEARRGLSFIGHSNGLKDDLSLAESLAFLAELAGLDRAPERARLALTRLGLSSRGTALVRTLSQGQRRRGALARLALDDSAERVWILDEPYDALDKNSMGLLSELIEAHSARGGAVLLTSHQPIDLRDSHEFDLESWRAA